MTLHVILVAGLLIAAIWAAFSADLLRSAIALLFVSIGLTLIFFTLRASLAAVFELSVCAGLITVLFVLTISLIQPRNVEETAARSRKHYRKFYPLPVLGALRAAVLWRTKASWLGSFPIAKSVESGEIGRILWLSRGLDLIGQITILLVGVYGVVVLFKRGKMNE